MQAWRAMGMSTFRISLERFKPFSSNKSFYAGPVAGK
jgi:hypothetical protein